MGHYAGLPWDRSQALYAQNLCPIGGAVFHTARTQEKEWGGGLEEERGGTPFNFYVNTVAFCSTPWAFLISNFSFQILTVSSSSHNNGFFELEFEIAICHIHNPHNTETANERD